MTTLRWAWEAAWPLLAVLLVLAALRSLPPANRRQQVLGGILLGLLSVRLLGEEMGYGAIGDPRAAYALLACLGVGLFTLSRALRLPDPF